VLKERGLLDRAGTYFVNSCQWMWRIRKHCFEKTRAADRVAGFDFLGDINGHWHTSGYSSGMMDEFFRLKPGETVENVRRYNSAAVVLADLGSDFVVTAGDVKTVAFSVSNYDAAAPDATLTITLTDAAGKGVWSETMKVGDVADGKVTALGKVKVRFPSAAVNAKYLLKASFAGGAVRAANEWEMYAFAPVVPAVPAPGVRVVSSISEKNLFDALAKGERVLLLGAGPFKSLPVTFRIGLAGRCSGNYATVIRPGHPVFDGLPHEGYCAWQFRRLMENAAAIQLEAGVPFDPIIDIASSEKFPIRQALMAEYSVGNGRLLVCPLKFSEKDPAAVWLKNSLIRYVSGPAFKPAHRLTPDRLRAVIRAPLLSGAKQNANRARNPNDLSGQVRAGAFAQP
jgi:hypothetical protein